MAIMTHAKFHLNWLMLTLIFGIWASEPPRRAWRTTEKAGPDRVNIELTSAVDANRTLVSNIGRAIVKKLAVKFEGNEIMSVDDFDVFACYRDLWKTKSEKRNAIQQGIISTDGCMENCIKLRINAGDKNTSNTQDKAIADVYGNKFIIPLDFEMLDSAAPYYQAGLGNRLCYKIAFNDHDQVTKSGVSSPKFQMQSIRSRTYP